MESVHKTEIKLEVGLDERRVPESITWTASEGPVEGPRAASALMLGLWDPEEKSAFRIDLWTKTMPVDEMHAFFHQLLTTLAATQERATREDELAEILREAAARYAEKAQELEKGASSQD